MVPLQEALFPLLNVPEKEKDRAKPFTISADRMNVGLKGIFHVLRGPDVDDAILTNILCAASLLIANYKQHDTKPPFAAEALPAGYAEEQTVYTPLVCRVNAGRARHAVVVGC